ncbi:MAG: ThuA domain-containing protein [Melioribacteraceae bacterium]|nr:ThuA domain-containing protein [Melioribacteraceae bacterium]
MIRKSRFTLLLLLSLIVFLSFQNISASQSETSKKILFVYGGWEGHEPQKFRDVVVPWLESQGFEVIQSTDLEIYTDSNLMAELDLIIQVITMSTITNEQEKGLLKAVKNGVSIAGWHGGLGDSFRNNPHFQFLVGGQWVEHPGGKIDYSVNITNPDDPIMQGLTDFKVHSEQYYMHVDPAVEILATTTFSGEHFDWIDGTVMPVVWKKYYGKGKVFYSSLGHSVEEFEVTETFTILKRGILWSLDEL